MSLWNTLKSAIVEDDGMAVEQPQAQVQTPQGVRPAGTVNFAPQTHLNQEMVDAIRKETFSRNTAMTQLITASDSLIEIIPDASTRMRAAQKMAGNGRQPKDFGDAVQIHLTDVDGIEMRFNKAIDDKVKAEVGGLTSRADATEKHIEQMSNEIKAMTERITRMQQDIGTETTNLNTIRAEASSKEAGLRQTHVEFKAAAEAVRQELNGHKATILSTLG